MRRMRRTVLICTLALALAQKFAPILAGDLADRRGDRNEAVLLMIDAAIGFQPVVARAHATFSPRCSVSRMYALSRVQLAGLAGWCSRFTFKM